MKDLKVGCGWVMHRRANACDLSFKYPIFNLLIPINTVEQKVLRLSLFPYLTLKAKDYLDSSNTGFSQKINQFLKEKLNYTPEKIKLQTVPRMFGYAFNPVSFWYLYKQNKLDAVLCEVNNTFGDRHFYFVKINPENQTYTLKKVFHVSPFFPIEGHYEFKFNLNDTLSEAIIDYFDSNSKLALATKIELHLSSFKPHQAFKLLLRYGWMTPMIILRIHYLAIKLWFKGKPFFRRPKPPSKNLSKK